MFDQHLCALNGRTCEMLYLPSPWKAQVPPLRPQGFKATSATQSHGLPFLWKIWISDPCEAHEVDQPYDFFYDLPIIAKNRARNRKTGSGHSQRTNSLKIIYSPSIPKATFAFTRYSEIRLFFTQTCMSFT